MTTAIHVKSPVLTWDMGEKARRYIDENGFGADDIDLLLGASGGPKWLVLAGLDRALFSEFLNKRSKPLSALASSIGSWRFAVMAQRNPAVALDRFLEAYLAQSYSEKVTIAEVSSVLDSVLSHLLGESGVNEILSHPIFRNHIVTIRCGGLLGSDNRMALMAGLSATFLGNLLGRSQLGRFCDRAVFADNRDQTIAFGDTLPTLQVPLSESNLELVLRASGAVPLVLEGIKNIPGAPEGVYRDGGVSDYHFAPTVATSQELVFYPHFYSYCIPGWFDKMLRNRHSSVDRWSNLVLVSPAPEFVARLPGGRIPDRKDFFKMDNQQRISFWKRTVEESERLGEAFLTAIESQRFF